MFCAISGEVPAEPVVSKLSGHLFEKRLIATHLRTSNLCPITGVTLTPADLLDVATASGGTAPPKAPAAASFPAALDALRSEWDQVMLETLTLKTHLEDTRKELSQALYQHDAACRVIARLNRERDELRALLAQQQNAAAAAAVEIAGEAKSAAPSSGAAEPKGISEELHQRIQEKSEKLRKGRKKRKTADDGDLGSAVGSWEVTKNITLHSASKPGVTALDVDPNAAQKIATGGMDKLVYVYDTVEDAILAKGKGHSKRVTAVGFHPDPDQSLLLSSSADKTLRLWEIPSDTGANAAMREKLSLRGHSMEVVGLAFHPLPQYAASASLDRSWAVWDLEDGRPLSLVHDAGAAGGYSCVDFHPDGLLLVTGTSDHLVKVWDVNSQACAATFDGHAGAVTALAHSSNGYHLASAALDGTVKLWDLRKPKCFKTLSPAGAADTGVTSVAFDPSGRIVAAGLGNGTAAFSVKGAEEPLVSFEENAGAVTALRWDSSSSFLATASMDRTVKFYGAA